MRVRVSGSQKVFKIVGVLTNHGTARLLQEAKKLFPNRLYTCEEEGKTRQYDVPLRRIDVSTETLLSLNKI